MLAIIGTYRKDEYLPKLMESLETYATGIDRYVFIDDSNDPFMATYLDTLGTVIETFGEGYGAAMKAAIEVGRAEDDNVVWLEEDFRLRAPVNFKEMSDWLDINRGVAQTVLQRQAWYPVEVANGGMIQAVRYSGKQVDEYQGYYLHNAFFSCNPSVWRKEIWKQDWPTGDNSEYKFYMRLKNQGYKFALTKDIVCHHDGVRSGKGY